MRYGHWPVQVNAKNQCYYYERMQAENHEDQQLRFRKGDDKVVDAPASIGRVSDQNVDSTPRLSTAHHQKIHKGAGALTNN